VAVKTFEDTIRLREIGICGLVINIEERTKGFPKGRGELKASF
jgi:hypothetical protein